MRQVLVLVVLGFLIACSGTGELSSIWTADEPLYTPVPDPWWQDAVFYEVFVGSFKDSDTDGWGDLRGLIEKLDYLNDGNPLGGSDLEVTALWLMPIFDSPSYHGYDVRDFKAIRPSYGTLDDLRTLLYEANLRGMRVILDLPLNHTSIEHPWFVQARRGPDNPARNFYIWQDVKPDWKSPWGSDVWHAAGPSFYYGLFSPVMPDLNYNSADVAFSMKEVIRYWIEDIGVDGFRLDGVKHLIEEGPVQEHTESTRALLRRAYGYIKSVNPEVVLVGEIWSDTRTIATYTGDQVDLGLEFNTAGAILESARTGRRAPVDQAFGLDQASYPENHFGTFLTNHDMVRVFNALDDNLKRCYVAASLLLTGPGIPFLYYGEEIGLAGRKPDENIRAPMQWAGDRSVGFSRGFTLWNDPQTPRVINVAGQTDDAGSLLSHYRRLIRLRNRNPALRRGTWTAVTTTDPGVYAGLRTTPTQQMLVVINLTDAPVSEYALSAPAGTFRPGLVSERLWEARVRDPEIPADGSLTGYKPLPVLDPHQTLVIEVLR